MPIGLIGLVLVTRYLHAADTQNERPVDIPA
jgi:hypothetical protein